MKTIIENAKAEFLIDVKTVSPLLQIEPSSEKDQLTKASMVKTKKTNYISEDGKLASEPFFSANGFRGITRRNIAAEIFSALEKKDNKKVSVDTVHLYSSGGGTTANGFVDIFDDKLNYSQMVDFRAKNPFISLFGAGLSDIDGKLSVADIKPTQRGTKLVDYLYGVRFDETERSSILTPLLDLESVENYKTMLSKKRGESASIRAKEKDIEKLKKDLDKEEKGTPKFNEILALINDKKDAIAIEQEEKGMSYQQVYKAEYIIPDTKMSSSVGTRAGYELTELERGMMLFGLIKTSQQNIGSYSRIGWGAMNWNVKDSNGDELFSTTCDEQYILNKKTVVSEKGKAILAVFVDYLENLNRDGIFLP